MKYFLSLPVRLISSKFSSIEIIASLLNFRGFCKNFLQTFIPLYNSVILKTKSGLAKGGGKREVMDRLRPLPNFVIEKCIAQEGFWQERELEEALDHIYDADGLIRSGSKGDLVLEGLIFHLCFPASSQ